MLKYRIHKKLIYKIEKVPSIPKEYFIRSFGSNIENEIELWYPAMHELFPRVFKRPQDFWNQFVDKSYFNPNYVFFAIEKETGKPVSIYGFQRLRHFCKTCALAIYAGTLEKHRRQGLIKALCVTTINQFVQEGFVSMLYTIPNNGTVISEIYQKIGFSVMDAEFTKNYTKCMQKDIKC